MLSSDKNKRENLGAIRGFLYETLTVSGQRSERLKLTRHDDKALWVMIHDISVADWSAAVTADFDHTAGHILIDSLLKTAGDMIHQFVVQFLFIFVLIHNVPLTINRELLFDIAGIPFRQDTCHPHSCNLNSEAMESKPTPRH